jgi:hypothetical protein
MNNLPLLKRAMFALFITLSTLFVHTFNPIIRLIDFTSAKLDVKIPASAVPSLSLFFVAAVIFGVLSTPIGSYLYVFWKEIEEGVAHKFPYGYDTKRKVYTQRDREGTLQRHMLQSLRKSDFMYTVLVSGFAMTFRDEKFIRDELENNLPLKELRRKQLLFLFLDPESEFWGARAEWLLEHHRDMGDDGTVDGYRRACAKIRHDLELLQCSVHVSYYKAAPAWRMYIFSDRIYVSHYAAPPHSYWEQGYRTDVVAYPRGDQMYEWLGREFKRLAPASWTDEIVL